MHIFLCPQSEPLKGLYPRVFNSRAYRRFYSAHENKLSEVDALFRTFLTQGGPEYWSQLAGFLIACCFSLVQCCFNGMVSVVSV
jgi:hypothetical protein